MFEAIAYCREKRSETITTGFKEADYFGESGQSGQSGHLGICANVEPRI